MIIIINTNFTRTHETSGTLREIREDSVEKPCCVTGRRLMEGQAKASHRGGGLDTDVKDNLNQSAEIHNYKLYVYFHTFNINHLQIHTYISQRETWKIQHPYTAKVHLFYEPGYVIFV
jgi:hypothetical protein